MPSLPAQRSERWSTAIEWNRNVRHWQAANLRDRMPPSPTSEPPSNGPAQGRYPVTKQQFLKSTILGLPLVCLAAAAGLAQQTPPNPATNLTPVTDAMLLNPPPSDWLMWRRTYDNNRILAHSDAHIVALEAKTGKVVFDHATADWSKGHRYTGGPFVVKGTIVQGMTGCGNAIPGGCFVTGHDAKTGAEKWRFQTIAQGNDPQANTWNGLPVQSRFGGSAWISGSYDPDQNLVFYGV